MNIIYRLTNIDKPSGKRYYIGSKVEAGIATIDGLPTIVSLKTGKPYYGSCSGKDMQQDLANGNRFSAEVLEVCADRRDIRRLENWWLRETLAIQSDEYYNDGHAIGLAQLVVNAFGQLSTAVAKDTSSLSKRDGTARAIGFKHCGEMAVVIANRVAEGATLAALAREYGQERHLFQRMFPGDILQKVLQEDPSEHVEAVRSMYARGASVKFAAEHLGITVYAARTALGDYGANKNFAAAVQRGLTPEELEVQVTKKVLAGEGFSAVAKSMGLTETMVGRYFMSCVRKRLKPSDLE